MALRAHRALSGSLAKPKGGLQVNRAYQNLIIGRVNEAEDKTRHAVHFNAVAAVFFFDGKGIRFRARIDFQPARIYLTRPERSSAVKVDVLPENGCLYLQIKDTRGHKH